MLVHSPTYSAQDIWLHVLQDLTRCVRLAKIPCMSLLEGGANVDIPSNHNVAHSKKGRSAKHRTCNGLELQDPLLALCSSSCSVPVGNNNLTCCRRHAHDDSAFAVRAVTPLLPCQQSIIGRALCSSWIHMMEFVLPNVHRGVGRHCTLASGRKRIVCQRASVHELGEIVAAHQQTGMVELLREDNHCIRLWKRGHASSPI
mmetsp:Transcript_32853/g.77008  ORF Transcript_32853/g.77008 Transcript_32853/m.77008 type:complete len:201 (-) Transcript_32853:219-821(-)